MSNIEEDIKEYNIELNNEQSVKILQDLLNEFATRGELLYIVKIAIDNVLTEREQDKKRIKELEEDLYRANEIVEEYDKQMDLDYVDKNYIPKQKVKEVLRNNRNEIFTMTYLSKEQYRPYGMQVERINKIEQELLEGG